MSTRKNRLAQAMKADSTALETAHDEPADAPVTEPEPETRRLSAVVEPVPILPSETDEPDEPVRDEDPIPVPVGRAPAEEPAPASAAEAPITPAPAAPAKVTRGRRSPAGSEQAREAGAAPADLPHLRRVMATGRDQRRYVEDLPRRSDKGTYLRLPVHLQDALSDYCDRNTAPMADFMAALLDAYFRDIGLLPPLGEGNHPNEDFLERLRKESRQYDY